MLLPAGYILFQSTLAREIVKLLSIGLVKLVFSEVEASWTESEFIRASAPPRVCSSSLVIRYRADEFIVCDIQFCEIVSSFPHSRTICREIITLPGGSNVGTVLKVYVAPPTVSWSKVASSVCHG